jgi:DNA-binding transcriptional ArsR family regulator
MPYTPDAIGWQRTDTSLNAARAMRPRARTIRAEVLSLLAQVSMAMTSEEIARALGKPYPSVQPRLAELRNMLMARDSGTRKIGRYGKPIIAWELSPHLKRTTA